MTTINWRLSAVWEAAETAGPFGAIVRLLLLTGQRREPRPLVVTEHRAHDCRCAACGAQTRALFPDGVNAPVQYGPRIGAIRPSATAA